MNDDFDLTIPHQNFSTEKNQPEKKIDKVKKPQNMTLIMDKMDHYFGEYEFGVFDEKGNDGFL